jgi:hypothetical protein
MPEWILEEETRIAALQESEGVSRSVAIRRMRAQDKAAAEAKSNSDILSESPAKKKYATKENGKNGKKKRWMVTYTTPKGITSPVGSKKYNTEAEAQAVADEYNSGTTVKSISKSNADDVKKREKAELANQRKQHLKEVESAAARLVKTWKTLEGMEEEYNAFYRKLADVVAEFKPQLEDLRYEFRRLKEGETINGHTSLETWCPEFLGVTARTFRRGLQAPKQVPLLPASLPEEMQPNETNPADLPEIPAGKDEAENPSLAESLADTKPTFAIGVSPADVVTNSVRENSRLILNYARSFGKLPSVSAKEWQEIVRLVIEGLQYELDDEPAVQVTMNIVPEGDRQNRRLPTPNHSKRGVTANEAQGVLVERIARGIAG